jgi:hypothetical protein
MPKCYADFDDRPAKKGQEIRFELRQIARQAFLQYEWHASNEAQPNPTFLQLLGRNSIDNV